MTNDPTRRWQLTTIVTLFVGYAAYYVCRSNLAVVGPAVQAEFDLSKTEFGMIGSAGLVMYTIGKITNGVLGDFLGGRAMFLMGMAMSVVCTLLFGFLSGLIVWSVIWAANRYFQSMGWVGLVKVSSRWFPVRRRATVMAVLSMSYLLGDAATRWYLGIFIDLEFGWRTVFFVSAGTLLGVAVINLFTLKNRPQDVGAQEPPANPANVFGADGEKARPASLKALLRPLVSNYTFWLICGMNFCLCLIREAFNFWNVTFLNQHVGMTEGQAAIWSSNFPLVGAVSCLLAGLFCDAVRGRHGWLIVPCVIILTGALALLASVELQGKPVLAITLTGLVAFFLMAPYTLFSGVMALDLGGKSGPATAAGLIDSAGYLGSILSGVGVGLIADHFGWSGVFFTLSLLAGVTVIISFFYLFHQGRLRREAQARKTYEAP